MATILGILLFYLPATVFVVTFLFAGHLASEYGKCIERLKNELPPERQTSCLHLNYMQGKAMRLAEEEHPAVAARMKLLRRASGKTLLVLILSLAIAIGGGIITKHIPVDKRRASDAPQGRVSEP